MRSSVAWHRLAIAAALGMALASFGTGARAAEDSDRQGRELMDQIAPAGACAAARDGSVGDSGGGAACGGTVGTASERFSPSDVAAGNASVAFNPPAPGAPAGPDLQPGEIGSPPAPPGPPGGGPTPPPPPVAPPPISVIESPAVPVGPPGLRK